nr:unnamed protein product [Callosobruchus analis]
MSTSGVHQTTDAFELPMEAAMLQTTILLQKMIATRLRVRSAVVRCT